MSEKLQALMKQRGYLHALHDVRVFLETQSIKINLLHLYEKYEEETNKELN